MKPSDRDPKDYYPIPVQKAVMNTPGAEFIPPHYIKLTVSRYQKPEQSGGLSVRTGVFYLPELKSPYQRHYKGGKSYGGSQYMSGTIVCKQPYTLRAGTGGLGPEKAFIELYIYFRNIDIDFLDGLKVYWLTTLKLQNSTINKRWRAFKQFLKSHRENKYKHWMDWETGLNHIKSNSNIHLLTNEEWNKYRNHKFNNNYLGYVRDLYIISCTTGLRFSDVIRLSPIHFREDGWIVINITKTEEGNLRIPLHPIAKEILERYNYQLRNISNQKCNVYLSKGLRECGIDYKVALYRKSGNKVTTLYLDKCDGIDFHSSRRHFVTKCVDGGIPINDIMAWTGHSSTTISKYIKKGGSNKDRMFEVFG